MRILDNPTFVKFMFLEFTIFTALSGSNVYSVDD